MASSHFKRKLIHQATVQRNTSSQSSTGEPIPSWAGIGTITCRFVEKTEWVANEAAGFPVLSTYLLLLADTETSLAEDVAVDDRVTDVVWGVDGSSVDAGPFAIESLLRRNTGSAHHYSLQLERVK